MPNSEPYGIIFIGGFIAQENNLIRISRKLSGKCLHSKRFAWKDSLGKIRRRFVSQLN